MIKFFRKIRQNLLSEGKTGSPAEASAKVGKYIKYSLGEILLIVIGILIALQINNWNEKRKNHEALATYLKALEIELKSDKIALSTFIENVTQGSKEHLNFRKKINNTRHNLDSLIYLARFELDPAITNINGLSNTTFETLINTGRIEIIPTKLRNELIRHYKYQNDIIKDIIVFRDLYFATAINFNAKYTMNLDYGFIQNESMKDYIWEDVDPKELIKDLNLWGTLKGNFFRNAIRDFEKSLTYNEKILSQYFS